MSLRIRCFLPAILWFLLSFYLLTIPGSQFPINTWFDKIQGDKLVHIFIFAMLSGFLLLPFKAEWTNPSILKKAFFIAGATLGYGIAMEYVQENFIPDRSFDVWDIVADGVGSFVPFLILSIRAKKTVPVL